MPLDISQVSPGLKILAAQITQFYNLFTGAMTDQNVSLLGTKNWFNGIGCRVYNDADITLGTSAVEGALTFNQERFDSDGIHSTVSNTGQLVCRTAGMYAIFATAEFANNGTGFRRLRIRLNGTTSLAGNSSPSDGTFQMMVSVATLYYLNVSDYVEAMALQTSGGSLNVKNNGNSSPEFGMVKVG